MSLPCPIDTCARDMPGTATICGACSAELGRALTSVGWLTGELETTLSRQTSKTGGGKVSETPLAFDPRASEAAWVLRSTLVGWVRVLAETDPDTAWPADSCESMAAWLSERRERLVRHPAATEAHGEILSAVRDAERVIDRPAERVFAGRCECGTALYARPGAAMVDCRECDADAYDVDAKREEMLGQVGDQLATATETARAVTRLGQPVSPSAIRGYVHRKLLVAHGSRVIGNREVPVYRLGDVLDILARQAQRDGKVTA